MATSASVAPAAAKIAMGRVETIFTRAAEMVYRWAETKDTMLVVVKARRMTTLFASGERVGGEMTPSVTMDAHVHAKVGGLGMGG